jgi:hypothetical protein
MPISAKHLATFLMGAAAGAAIMKYNSLSDEEKEKLVGDFKAKANEVKGEAENALSHLQEYFEEIKTKGLDTLKTQFGEAEGIFKDLFAQQQKAK